MSHQFPNDFDVLCVIWLYQQFFWDFFGQNCGLRMHRECRERFTRHQLQRKPRVIDPGMHHGTCISHVPWCMTVGITNPRWRGKRSRHSRGMRNPQFYVSAKRPIVDPYPSVSFQWHCDNPGTASNASEAYLLAVTHLSGGWSYGSTTIRSALFDIDRFLIITRHNTTQAVCMTHRMHRMWAIIQCKTLK